MATQKADYYDILGVARSASADEGKRAFRRLAMQYHPDRHPEPGAGTRFKEINEAYEGLSAPAFAAASQPRRRAPSRGADLQVQIELTFEEAAFGAERSIVVNRTELCSKCSGLRAEPGTEPQRCPTCDGAGEVRRVQRSVFGQFINVAACDRCRGEGWVIPTPCTHCRGTGRERVTRTLQVKIPAGVDNGSQIRLAGEGELGAYGGPRGNCYVVLRVAPHPFFERDEDDLHVQLNISIVQAALGDELEVPTLDGAHKLKVAPGTESGDVITLRGKGVPHLRGGGRGDLLVHAQVTTPKHLSAEQKRLLRELEKVKDAFG